MLCLVSIARAATPAAEHRVQDLYYGQALYQYFQQNKLAAITRLMTAATRPPLASSQPDEANLLLADLYYNYGLYEESRSLFAQLLDAEVSDSIQNRIWFNLARVRYDQGYRDDALNLLSRINDQLPQRIEAERKYLLTNLYLGSGEYDLAANESLQIDSKSIWKSYARYNLGVALIENQDLQQGEKILNELGQMEASSEELLALRDQSNLSLGLKHLRLGQPQPALQSLLRIRLEGPLSNKALLASGWAWYRLDQFDKALQPWRFLLQRNAIDLSTQEAILAIPANYVESGDDRLAIRYYKMAAQQFDLQLESLEGAIRSIGDDALIDALRETNLLQDRGNLQRQPPVSVVTPQLQLLLASEGFHREIKRYQDLLDIRQSLGDWGNNLPALELMLGERSRAFAERLPMLEQSASFDQYEQFTLRRDELAEQLSEIESSENYLALAGVDELDQLERMQSAASSIANIGSQRDTADQQQTLRLLSGLLNYQLATDYPRRIWKSRKQLIQLDRALNEADARVVGLRGITDRTQLDLADFRGRISGQTEKISALGTRVAGLLQQQEQRINQLAIEAIRVQQQHVRQLRLNARYELARISDKLATPQ
ncbi:MAG: hypothetical protein LJE92_18010 [Gammaproteobacteria bacterium]|nr:hypothetical protein [Gammaproteobacteria bacterium]